MNDLFYESSTIYQEDCSYGSSAVKQEVDFVQIIILGFSCVILFGTFLLMLPFSSRSGLVGLRPVCHFTADTMLALCAILLKKRIAFA